jgi:hypothetical protein
MLLRVLALTWVVAVPQLSLAQQRRTANQHVPDSCPITKRGEQPIVPPPPYPAKAPKGNFWYGMSQMWTLLGDTGTWAGLGHYTPNDPTFRQKLFYWRQGYDWNAEPRPRLTVTGRRLDAAAPPLMADAANGGYREEDWKSFMVVGINLPTLGCWEIKSAGT